MHDDRDIDIAREWGLIEQYGKILYGNMWQTEMTAALGMKDSAHLRAWKRRGVPARVWQQIKVIAQDKIAEIKKGIVINIK